MAVFLYNFINIPGNNFTVSFSQNAFAFLSALTLELPDPRTINP